MKISELIRQCENLIQIAPDKATELEYRKILANLKLLEPTVN